MNEYDRVRIENAIWVLEQYEDDLINNANDIKLMDYEVKSTFDTLRIIKGITEMKGD